MPFTAFQSQNVALHEKALFIKNPTTNSSSFAQFYMTVQGRQQQLQSSVLMQLHFPPWGLTIEPAVDEMDEVDAGIVAGLKNRERMSSRL